MTTPTKQLEHFQPGDKVGFVYDNALCIGTFDTYQMDNTEAVVSYNDLKLRFTDCSIYSLKPRTPYANRNNRRTY